jgi:hypothetical protein
VKLRLSTIRVNTRMASNRSICSVYPDNDDR